MYQIQITEFRTVNLRGLNVLKDWNLKHRQKCTTHLEEQVSVDSQNQAGRISLNFWVMHPVARVPIKHFLQASVRNDICSSMCITSTTCFGPDRWPSSGDS
jgi:hypothetical protein